MIKPSNHKLTPQAETLVAWGRLFGNTGHCPSEYAKQAKPADVQALVRRIVELEQAKGAAR